MKVEVIDKKDMTKDMISEDIWVIRKKYSRRYGRNLGIQPLKPEFEDLFQYVKTHSDYEFIRVDWEDDAE